MFKDVARTQREIDRLEKRIEKILQAMRENRAWPHEDLAERLDNGELSEDE